MAYGSIHHLEVYVSNLQASKQFWEWLLTELNYTAYQSWDKGFSFKLGETYLVFVQIQEKYNDLLYHRCGVGLNHIAFHAHSRQHVDQLTKKLRQKNIEILYPDKHPFAGGQQHYALYFEDPDRIKVEIVAP
ncbi:Catechol 2,3-dioxygenase [Amphibacillus marinus]|uniref:Catechol 2,3-dioxygenase n=1 Tax=Amphibacillus marinus TaxID=872970 RepID=A0A1H8SZ51_9BACI|nr:VOC family protein [Amphibacillus marinus]SEO83614.1 Catechol 2,3-dioxygenase [Amphibacillus marinus]